MPLFHGRENILRKMGPLPTGAQPKNAMARLVTNSRRANPKTKPRSTPGSNARCCSGNGDQLIVARCDLDLGLSYRRTRFNFALRSTITPHARGAGAAFKLRLLHACSNRTVGQSRHALRTSHQSG